MSKLKTKQPPKSKAEHKGDYSIIILCKNQEQQNEVYQALIKLGLKMRILCAPEVK